MDILKQFVYSARDTLADVPPIVIGIVILGIIGMAILTYVVHSFLLSYLFRKMGIKTWKAWIPLYQYWPVLEAGRQKGYWSIFLLIPPLNIPASILLYLAMYRIGLKFGKEKWFIALGIFVPIVWIAWLAFDGSKWPGKKKPVLIKGGLKD